MQMSNICVLKNSFLFSVTWRPLLGTDGIHADLQTTPALWIVSCPHSNGVFLRCRWAAEPAAARRTDRDRLSKERLRARQRGSGLPAHAYRAEPLSEMTRKCGLWLIRLFKTSRAASTSVYSSKPSSPDCIMQPPTPPAPAPPPLPLHLCCATLLTSYLQCKFTCDCIEISLLLL